MFLVESRGGGTLRVEIKLRIYLILLIIGVVRLAAYFILGVPLRAEINQKLSLKINQKFIWEHLWCSLLGMP